MADDPNPDDIAEDQVEDAADDADESTEDADAGDDSADDGAADADDSGSEDQGDDQGDEPPRRQSRGANLRHRAQTAEKEAKELRERVERLERDRPQPRQQSDEDRARAEREERAMLDAMSPEERFAFLRDKDRKEYRSEIAGAERRVAARMDRSDFKSLLADKPHLKKYESEVEQRFNEAFQGGGFVGRETILKFVLGDAVMNQAPKAAAKQRAQADARRARETTRPGGARSDVAANRTRRGKTAADRLADVTF